MLPPRSLRLVLGLLLILTVAVVGTAARAQVLPPHPPLRILIVSDEVNPHGLPPEDLTQPGEISAALLATSALHIDAGVDAILELPTDQIEDAGAGQQFSDLAQRHRLRGQLCFG